jgi:hypothetical protein
MDEEEQAAAVEAGGRAKIAEKRQNWKGKGKGKGKGKEAGGAEGMMLRPMRKARMEELGE